MSLAKFKQLWMMLDCKLGVPELKQNAVRILVFYLVNNDFGRAGNAGQLMIGAIP